MDRRLWRTGSLAHEGANGRWTHPLFTSLPVSSGVANRFSVHLKVASVNCATTTWFDPVAAINRASGYSATGKTGTSRSRHYNTDDVAHFSSVSARFTSAFGGRSAIETD
jgi:hypothetical protein